MDNRAELMTLLVEFVSRRDISLGTANKIESLIAVEFSEDDPIQELAEDLAQYTPGGGDYLFSEEQMVPRAAAWLARLREKEASFPQRGEA